MLTSQRLLDGMTVFYTPDGRWSEQVDEAQVFDGPDEAAIVARAQPDEIANRVVASYVIDVEVQDGAVVPTRIRERIRALGPTVRPDLQRVSG